MYSWHKTNEAKPLSRCQWHVRKSKPPFPCVGKAVANVLFVGMNSDNYQRTMTLRVRLPAVVLMFTR